MHSFYLDTCQSPELRRAVLGLTSGAQRVLAGLGRAAEAWKRHQALWKSNKQLALDKFKVQPHQRRGLLCKLTSALVRERGLNMDAGHHHLFGSLMGACSHKIGRAVTTSANACIMPGVLPAGEGPGLRGVGRAHGALRAAGG